MQENHIFFFEIIFEENFLFFYFLSARPNPAHVAGLDPASLAWSLTQASDPLRPRTRKSLRVHEQCEGN